MSDVDGAVAVEDTPARFPSAAALRAAHGKLLERRRLDGDRPEFLAEAEVFVRRGQATGAVLDADHDPDPDFTLVIEGLWRQLLAGPGAPEAFRRYEFALAQHSTAVEAYVDMLSGGAQERFLTAAGVDWQRPPRWPTCAHAGCCLPWFDALAEWRRPVRERVWSWLVEALRNRVRVQSTWPGPDGATGCGRPWLTAPRRWTYPRPLPWEAGDAR